MTGRKRILPITHKIVPESDRWPAAISCADMVIPNLSNHLNTHETLTEYTVLQNFCLKYEIDEHDRLFFTAEPESDICFTPILLDFAAHEVIIFRKQ